jgi:hypothetical protein
MTRTGFRKIALAALLATLASAAVLAECVAPAARYIIFSNLDSTPGARYNSGDAFTIAGREASGETETWQAIRFKPEVDVQANVILAAIGYTSGTKLVTLGLYSNNDNTGSVGDPLPGGQGSTSQIPDDGECCQLAKVTLAGEGVFLAGGTPYWLVAGPDNVNAPDFKGTWQLSNLAISAYLQPPFPWNPLPGQWPAAQIRGTRLQALGPSKPTNFEAPSPGPSTPAANVTIFTNLDRISTEFYIAGAGVPVNGNNVPFEGEVWEALPFTPTANVRARTLAAAVGYVSGTRLVRLGINSDNGGTVGTPLPGGEGSTRQIPDLGECCELTKVKLPGAGVALTAGTRYWLVASPDNINAPSFAGRWQSSSLAVRAYQQPENFVNWTSLSGIWLAAEIRGTSP